MKRILLVLFFSACYMTLFAQEKAPLLTGKVNISIAQGTFECDLTLTDIPNVKDYYIRLNSGMNPLHFRSKEPQDFLIYYDKTLSDSTSTGESNAYIFPDNTRKNKFLPKTIQFKYVGKFPVVKDTLENYSRKDWKGNIAFNHNSVRTDGVQSAWYPVLYDAEMDKTYEELRYNIEINCIDCTTLYVNGNAPVKSSSAKFKSDTPKELTLFCGNYDFSNMGNTFILNTTITQEQIKEFSLLINSYKKFYTEKLNIPFDQPVTFVETTPTSRADGWLFVSYPTILDIGWGDNGFKSLFDPKMQNWYRPFIAHELGHYYFGTYKVFNSELGDMMAEGFAEYLSLQLTKEVIGKEVYDKKMQDKIEELEDFTPVPFRKIKSQKQYDDRELYVYYYAPVIFTAIEKEIGQQKMWQWISVLLKDPSTLTNYEFLTNTLRKTLKNEKTTERIIQLYFDHDASLQNALNMLKTK